MLNSVRGIFSVHHEYASKIVCQIKTTWKSVVHVWSAKLFMTIFHYKTEDISDCCWANWLIAPVSDKQSHQISDYRKIHNLSTISFSDSNIFICLVLLILLSHLRYYSSVILRTLFRVTHWFSPRFLWILFIAVLEFVTCLFLFPIYSNGPVKRL